jgi:hypothetical protein
MRVVNGEQLRTIFSWHGVKMPDVPNELDLFIAIFGGLDRRGVARVCERLGWEVRRSGWAEYEMRSPVAELEVQAESPVLLHGSVLGNLDIVESVLAPLREAGAVFEGECYDANGKQLRDYKSGAG